MTRTSKYLNQDTIAALQAFQIKKIDREITDFLDKAPLLQIGGNYSLIYCV